MGFIVTVIGSVLNDRIFVNRERMEPMIKVLVNGALGKMGSTVVRTVLQQEDMELISAVDVHGAGKTVEGVPVDASLEEALIRSKPDVVVDFTRPDVVMDSLRIITSHGVNAVVGTTGFSPEDLEEVKGLAEKWCRRPHLSKLCHWCRFDDESGGRNCQILAPSGDHRTSS